MRDWKILVVEDESLIALHLKCILINAGCVVCGIAGNAEEAIDYARAERPDAILMDIHLPGLKDGIDAAIGIRTFLDSAIIFMTGYSDPGIRERALAMEHASYLVKPIRFGDIDAILQTLNKTSVSSLPGAE